MIAKATAWPGIALRLADDADRFILQIWPHAYRIALSILRDRGLAEDAAQEACAIVYRAVWKLRASAAFNVWFYRIVIRTALSMRKKRDRFGDESEAEPIASDGAAASVMRVDVMRALAQATRFAGGPRGCRAATGLRNRYPRSSPSAACVLASALTLVPRPRGDLVARIATPAPTPAPDPGVS
jgi:hypothetical protein